MSQPSSTPALRHLRSRLIDHLRRAHASVLCRPVGQGPLVVFMPSGPVSDGAVRLRMHEVARAIAGQGWRTAVLPWKLSLEGRRRLLARTAPDVLVMQGVRHPLNRPHLYDGVPVLLDVDDADFHLNHLARPMAEAMNHVRGVIAGSAYIARWCRRAGAPMAEVVWTGAPVSTAPRPPQADRPPVLAWAQTRPETYLREADLVARVSSAVAQARPGTVLRLYDRRPDSDPAFARRFAAEGLRVEWRATLTWRDYLASFDDVAIGLAPLCAETPFSRGKSFGKVLSYLDRKVVVIGSDAGEHGRFFTPRSGVITNDVDRWVQEAVDLLDDPVRRQATADAGFASFVSRLATGSAAARVAEISSRVIT